MFANFVDTQLAGIDNLDELKVTLTALRLIEQRCSEMASVTEADLLAHPAVRDGLRMPAITLRPALQMAVARGTLVMAATGTAAGSAVHYFRNDADGRRAAAAFERNFGEQPTTAPDADYVLQRAGTEIARLESIDFYTPTPDDRARVEEWLARGYTAAEILAAVREALLHPRARSAPYRTLSACEAALFCAPPAQPSDFYEICVMKTRRAPEEIMYLRLQLNRNPTHVEFALMRDAVGLFGVRPTIAALGNVARNGSLDLTALIPLLTESEEATFAAARAPAANEIALRRVLQMYETTLGLPVSSHVADDIRATLAEAPDLKLWQAALAFAAREDKKSWPYIRKMLLNPSPTLFLPEPVNAAAQLAFDIYRRRVNRTLDPVVAGEINALATTLTDTVQWSAAFDVAAAANALRWDYIRSVLTPRPERTEQNQRSERTTDARRQPERKSQRRSTSFRREQVEFSPEQRQAAEERARRELEEDDE